VLLAESEVFVELKHATGVVVFGPQNLPKGQRSMLPS
jgi:hypothetical protein